jgi:anhydro-N-acetylmuramic acid kinase
MTSRWFIGLASGSSADHVDAALVEAQGAGLDMVVKLVHGLQQPLPPDLRDLLFRLQTPSLVGLKQLGLVHRLLSEALAAAAREVADRVALGLHRVQCLGCSGHHACHEPEGRFPTTLPLGMAAVVAERTGITTVSDFRARDLAAGGQGVPTAALADYLLFRHSDENRVLVHLGGTAEVVFLPAGGRVQDVLGFEAGPCNWLLDGLMRQATGGRLSHDPGGKHAVQGRCLEALLERWLGHPYLHRRPPKALPRGGFGDEFLLQTLQAARQTNREPNDLLCTAAHFVVRVISHALRCYLPGDRPIARVLLSGGGVRNGLLWRLLEEQLEEIPLARTDQFGVPAAARKAMTMAILAGLTLDGVPASLASVTGASGTRLLGSLTPGSGANWARCLSWMAAQTVPPFHAD